jgi:uncharacterized Zn finger protein
MIKIVCPACKDEKGKYEIVNVVPKEEGNKYEVRCPDCGKTFVVYGKNKGSEQRPS